MTVDAPEKSLRSALEACVQGCRERLELWERILNKLRPQTMLEVGVWKGAYAAHILARCEFIRIYYMIDPWRKLPDWNKPANVDDKNFDMIYREAMDATNFARSKITVLRGTTVEVVDRIREESLDFAYVDGDHSLRGITIDLLSVWPKIRPGGYLAGDDLWPSIWQHPIRYEPTLVFPFALYFAEAVQAPVYALPYQQFLIQKPAGSQGYEFSDLVGSYGQPNLREQMVNTQAVRQLSKVVLGSVRRAVDRLCR